MLMESNGQVSGKMVNHITELGFIYGLIVRDMREESLKGCIKVKVQLITLMAQPM